MLRKFIATALLVVALHAETEKFQVIANDVDTRNNILIATGNVVIFSPTYYITAQKIIYDKNKGTFELFDDVVILKNNNVQTKSDYAFLDVNSDDLYQKPNMFFEQSNAIWINSKKSEKREDTIYLDEALISSCDCVDPDWSIRVSDADYDTKDKWINAYNTRIYVKDVPVLYSPYLGFSTDNTRRSGLLMPTFGYSKREGATYIQPIYLAPKPNYDLEFIPQYRGNRGSGMYAYWRYADSIDSILKISAGYFKEREEYQILNELRNDKHYGVDIDYERYNLFTGKRKEHHDGLFIDINYLNDIEYITLEETKNKEDSVTKVESKINYFYNTPEYYMGTYLRYYIDTTKDSNAATLQELPKIQLHSFSKPLLFEKLLYSTDIKFTNHTRSEGITANQYELNLPVSYSFSLFDDYLRLTAKHEFVFNKFNYGNDNNSNFEDGTYGESNTIISLDTDLVKPYEEYIHTMNLGADYKHSKTIKEDGDLYGITNNSSLLSPFPISGSSDSVTLSLNQSLYDRDSLKQIINHKMKQTILYNEYDELKFQNLENQVIYNYILGSVNNRLVYNFEDDQLIESSTSFNMTYDKLYFSFGHYMSKDTPNSGKEELESYQFTSRYQLSDEYSISYYTNYNLEKDIRTKQGLAFNIKDSCWNFDVRYEREIEAASTIDGDPIEQDIVYLQLLLNPLGGFMQEYEIERD